jgi:hypothetical protein
VKEALRGRFSYDEEAIGAVQNGQRRNRKTFSDVIKKICETLESVRYSRGGGGYVEK